MCTCSATSISTSFLFQTGLTELLSSLAMKDSFFDDGRENEFSVYRDSFAFGRSIRLVLKALVSLRREPKR